MATINFNAVDEAIRDVIQGIPGAQEGESVSDYRTRVTDRMMEIVDAISNHKKHIDRFIQENSDAKLNPMDQFYNANRMRFIPNEFRD